MATRWAVRWSQESSGGVNDLEGQHCNRGIGPVSRYLLANCRPEHTWFVESLPGVSGLTVFDSLSFSNTFE